MYDKINSTVTKERIYYILYIQFLSNTYSDSNTSKSEINKAKNNLYDTNALFCIRMLNY